MHREQPTIRDLAYQLWEARGRPNGSPERDWLDAERQLTAEAPAAPAASSRAVNAAQDTFPASDPPASRPADEPPADAEKNLRAAGAARAGGARKKTDRREKSRPQPGRLDG